MKFSIRALLILTLIAAINTHTWLRSRRIARLQVDIFVLQGNLRYPPFDGHYIDAHTLACEQAIKANPLPSPYFVAAQQRLESQFPAKVNGKP